MKLTLANLSEGINPKEINPEPSGELKIQEELSSYLSQMENRGVGGYFCKLDTADAFHEK